MDPVAQEHNLGDGARGYRPAGLSAAECARIGDVPTLIWRLKDHEFFKSFYSTPPTRYPDGRMCFKIGGEHKVSPQLRDREEFSAWFRSPGDPREIEQLKRVLLSALPGLNVDGWQSKPCVTTYTAHGRPYVDELEKNLFVATGGCGAAAKSSNEIGRLASLLIEDKPWPQEISRQSFGVKTL